MKSRKIYIVLALLVSVWTGAFAQDSLKVGEIMVSEDSVAFSDAYLDSVDVRKNNIFNDYTLIGVQYGMGLNQMSWNPRMEQKTQFSPVNFGITWTRFCKMFGYMPYFGIQAGVFYAREGYLLEEEYNVQGAQEVTMDIVEVQKTQDVVIDEAPSRFDAADIDVYTQETDVIETYRAPLIFGKDKTLAESLIYGHKLNLENQDDLYEAEERDSIRRSLQKMNIMVGN